MGPALDPIAPVMRVGKEYEMTVDEVKERVSKIEALRHDDESAHSEEDSLYFDVLQAIATGECIDPAGCAEEALKTAGICFSRWYA